MWANGENKRKNKMNIINTGDQYYDSIISGLLETAVDSSVDYGELALDYFLDDKIIKDIPIIGTLVNLGKCIISIKSLQFAKNYYTFIQLVRNNKKTVEELEKHIKSLNNNPKQMKKEIDTLLIYLEEYKNSNKIQYMFNIYRAFLSPGIFAMDWNQTLIYFEILGRLLPDDIEALKKIAVYGAQASEFSDHSELLRLSALGLVQYFNGKEVNCGHDKHRIARLTIEGKRFYRIITTQSITN